MARIGKSVNAKGSVSRVKISGPSTVINNPREINYYWKALQAARRGTATSIQWSRIEHQARLARKG